MAIEFGKGPVNFEEALNRLPPKNHPLIRNDEEIAHLYSLRSTLEETLKAFLEDHEIRLDERMVPLTPGEMRLLERWSFKRGEVIKEAFWPTIREENIWSAVYDPGYDFYKRWKISFLDPNVGNKKHFLVCIETNSSFSGHAESEFNAGLVTWTEIQELTNDLNKQ